MSDEMSPAGQKKLETAAKVTRTQLTTAMDIVRQMPDTLPYKPETVLAVAQILAVNWQTVELRVPRQP
jgi:hypothetical protein